VAKSDASLSLALSPLLPPLRFAARAGVARLNGLEPLVAQVVKSAGAFASGDSLERLSAIEAAAHGFDGAAPEARATALAALVRVLGSLVPLPEDVAALSGAAAGPVAPRASAGLSAAHRAPRPSEAAAKMAPVMQTTPPRAAEKVPPL